MILFKRILRVVLLIAMALAVFRIMLWAINPSDAPEWTGFSKYCISPNVEPEKKLWDWLDLLLVPAFLAIAAWLISQSEKSTDRRRELDRFEHDNLAKYFELMTSLFVQDKLNEKSTTSQRSVGRIQTLRILRLSSGSKKGEVLQFLYEADMIQGSPIVSLNGANLCDGEFDNIILKKCEIRGAYFCRASLVNAHLDEGNFGGSDFTSARLTGAHVNGASFKGADFKSATLKNMDLRKANIEDTDFKDANLDGSVVTAQQFAMLKVKNLKAMPKVK